MAGKVALSEVWPSLVESQRVSPMEAKWKAGEDEGERREGNSM
jgi:hypothetical protein